MKPAVCSALRNQELNSVPAQQSHRALSVEKDGLIQDKCGTLFGKVFSYVVVPQGSGDQLMTNGCWSVLIGMF
jgi:hypothetical protein